MKLLGPGEWVRVSRPTDLKVDEQVVDRLPQGTIGQVVQVEGDRVWLEGQKGWVSGGDVQTGEELADGVVGFRLGPVLRPLCKPVVSKQDEHFAVIAEKGDGMCVVLDGQAGPEFDGIGAGSLVFSPDGRRFAYGAKQGNTWFVVLDGQVGPEFDGVGEIVFSPDGRRFAYGARKGKKWFVVLDGQAGPEFDGIGEIVFSPDGRRFAYAVRKGEKEFVVVDGQVGSAFDGIVAGPLVAQGDGAVIYYTIKDGHFWHILHH